MTNATANIVREERIDGPGDRKIFVRSWRPEGKVRGVVAICHGVNSHSGYYTWAAEQLVASGLAVYAAGSARPGQVGRRALLLGNDRGLQALD